MREQWFIVNDALPEFTHLKLWVILIAGYFFDDYGIT